MKISRNTPEQLIIENNPVLVSSLLVLMAMIFVGVGVLVTLAGDLWFGLPWLAFSFLFFGFMLFMFARRNQLILDRTTGTLTHRRKSMRGYIEVVHDLSHLSEAVVETSQSGDSGPTHRMVYVLSGGMDAGRHPFTVAYTSGRGAERAANAINGWLDSQVSPD